MRVINAAVLAVSLAQSRSPPDPDAVALADPLPAVLSPVAEVAVRDPVFSRNQLVLDMSRADVVEGVFHALCEVLDHASIDYVKWDFNRSVTNVYSHALDSSHQGEVAHRFVLGTYRLLEKLKVRYPDLIIEGCSGGGGRFDAGMLFYCPQIWCSDDTDPIERLETLFNIFKYLSKSPI